MSSNPIASRVLRKLDVQDALCPVCREIYIEPVSLPCRHLVCLHCLEKTLACPVCRKRIATFLRQTKSLKKIVDQPFWEEVKSQFPNEIKKKQKGKSVLTHDQNELVKKRPSKFDKLISQALEKDRPQKPPFPKNKEEIQLDKEIQESMLYIKTNLFAEKAETLVSSPSTSATSSEKVEHGRDSITSEFTHFTPICAAPRTPPKIMPNGEKQIVPIYQPKNLCALNAKDLKRIQTVRNKTTLKISSNNFSRTKRTQISVETSDEERKIEEKARQEQEDLSLALKLHVQWNKDKVSSKRKHSYKLRSAKKKK